MTTVERTISNLWLLKYAKDSLFWQLNTNCYTTEVAFRWTIRVGYNLYITLGWGTTYLRYKSKKPWPWKIHTISDSVQYAWGSHSEFGLMRLLCKSRMWFESSITIIHSLNSIPLITDIFFQGRSLKMLHYKGHVWLNKEYAYSGRILLPSHQVTG